jgi:hypothetical protein
MSMLLGIFATLLAWGGAAAWVLTGGDKLRSDLKRNGRPGATGRLISATAGSRPVPSLNFGEAREAAPSSPLRWPLIKRFVTSLNC